MGSRAGHAAGIGLWEYAYTLNFKENKEPIKDGNDHLLISYYEERKKPQERDF